MNRLNLAAGKNPVLGYVSHRIRFDSALRVLAATCEELPSPYPGERVFKLPAVTRWDELRISPEQDCTVYDLVLAVTWLGELGLTEERWYRSGDGEFIAPFTEEYGNALTVMEEPLEALRTAGLPGNGAAA